MTGGLGFTKFGQALQRVNRSFLKHTRKVKQKKDDLIYRRSLRRYEFKKSSKKGLEATKTRILKQRRREIIKSTIILIATFILIGVIYLLLRKYII